MIEPKLQALLDAVLQSSRELLALAEASDWKVFEQRFAEREKSLAALDAQVRTEGYSQTDLDQLRQQLETLKALNDQLVVCAQQQQNELQNAFSESNHAQRAVHAYKK